MQQNLHKQEPKNRKNRKSQVEYIAESLGVETSSALNEESLRETNTQTHSEPTGAPLGMDGAERMELDGCPNTEAGEKIEVDSLRSTIGVAFYGSDVIRDKAPQVMEFVDRVVTHWQQNGPFDDLPVKNTLAKRALAEAFKNAKKVERKLDEKGIFEAAKSSFDALRSKIDKRH